MKIIKGSGLHCMYCGAKMEPKLVPVREIYPWMDNYCSFTGKKRYVIVDVCPEAEGDEEYYKHFRAYSNKVVTMDDIGKDCDNGCNTINAHKYPWCF
jgi:hypothetical protein